MTCILPGNTSLNIFIAPAYFFVFQISSRPFFLTCWNDICFCAKLYFLPSFVKNYRFLFPSFLKLLFEDVSWWWFYFFCKDSRWFFFIKLRILYHRLLGSPKGGATNKFFFGRAVPLPLDGRRNFGQRNFGHFFP